MTAKPKPPVPPRTFVPIRKTTHNRIKLALAIEVGRRQAMTSMTAFVDELVNEALDRRERSRKP